MLRSTRVTRIPLRARARSADRPAKPAPTTTTLGASEAGARLRLPILTTLAPYRSLPRGSGPRVDLAVRLARHGVGDPADPGNLTILTVHSRDLGRGGVRHVALRRRAAH